jgi:hypothetical protein
MSFLALFSVSMVSAQTGSIRGFIYEEESGEPVIFTNVYLQGTNMGSSTDVNGFFLIGDIPFGDYTIMVTYLGYDTLKTPISIVDSKLKTEKYFLKRASIQMEAFEVSAQKQESRTNVNISQTKATPKDIQQIPTIGATPDLAQYIQVIPGVVFTGDQGGQLYIRGGSPIQNKVLMDGMTIYNPFHSIGLFSVFDTELIRSADIYTAGFGAEYGGRVSSIMDITMRDGNKKRVQGRINASTFGAGVTLEGPFQRLTTDGKSSSSFVLSAKHSYLDESSKIFYGYIDEPLPYSFTDLYGKVSFSANSGSKVSLFGFNFNDQAQFQENSNLDWNSYGAGANFVLVPSGSPVLVSGRMNWSQYDITLIEQSVAADGSVPDFLEPRTSGINSFNLGIDFDYFNGDNQFKYGIDITGFGTNFTYYSSTGQRLVQEENNTELAGFAAYKFIVKDLILDIGFRAQYYASIRVISPEPRLGAKYNITDKLRLKGAFGMYSQNLISAGSDRDVVNLFYGFLVAPQDLQDTFTQEDGTVTEVNNPLQKAQHYILGVEYDVTDKISVNVEGYIKNFSQLTGVNRNKIFSKNQEGVEDIYKNDFIVESGNAKGVDFNLKYDDSKLYIWAVYSLSLVERWDGIQTYNPVYDRRNNVNIIVSYKMGKRNSWEVNGRWNYGSGFPFTQTQGYYMLEAFEGDINTDITETNTEGVETQLADINQGRLPAYSRLDFTVKKTFFFSENSFLEASVSITNVYNRENIFYIDRLTNERVNQLPFMPSVGLLYAF